jgi:DNA-binding transcriptional LysR family regulator
MNVEVLFDDPWVVVAGINSRWARRRQIALSELVNEPWLLTPPETASRKNLERAFRARGLGIPAASMVTYSVHLCATLASRGRFLTVIPKSLLRPRTKGYQLKMLPVDVPAPAWPVTIMTLKSRTLSPVVERFIECAREVSKAFANKK